MSSWVSFNVSVPPAALAVRGEYDTQPWFKEISFYLSRLPVAFC